MNYIPWILKIVHFCLRKGHPHLRTEILGEAHRDAAIALLSQQFVEREPLCRALGLSIADVQPSFVEQVDFAIEQGLSITAVNDKSELVAVLTVEDHARPFPPSTCPPRLLPLLEYLESIVIPSELNGEKAGRIFYCGLAAVAPGQGQKAALPLMMLALYWHTKALGFTQGYAKITNDRIIARLRSLEKYTLQRIFKPRAIAKAAEFSLGNTKPFGSYAGSTALYVWPIP